ncbi:hypothetical protein Fmac_018905 [Flemingia macrophylla]|uniref:WRKY domain-containing protein n=1 Tax=Flemingia macrophylla TaxID=520843 RepID=A0ABD1M6C6_9FABA
MENQVPNVKKAMEEELIRGRDIANQLVDVLVHDKLSYYQEVEGVSNPILPFVEDLVNKVLCSFTNALLLLNSNNDVSDDVAASITLRDVSSSTSCPKLEHVEETCKSPNTLNTKNRRRGYKRKSIAPTWEKDSSMLTEDGYLWRKYGQKMTLNAKFLRSYYRCTHKNDQGCQAMKQVQRIQGDPPLFRTTYYGHHTCKTPLNPEIILEPLSPSLSSSTLLSFSFNNSITKSKQENPFLLASTKHEPVEVIPDGYTAKNELFSPEEFLLNDYEDNYSDYLRHVAMPLCTEPLEFDNVYEAFGI